MSILRRWGLVLLASSILGGCASKDPAHAYERRNELYESIANPGTRLVYETATYLQRMALYLDSQDIAAGVYKPTELYRALSASATCSLSSMNLMDAILTGKTSAYVRSQPALLPLPVEKTPLEIMNEQRRNSPFEFGSGSPVRLPQASCEQCDAQSSGVCGDSWSSAVPPALELANLAYVVVVTNPQKCCGSQTQPHTRDILSLQAEKELAQYKISAAATIYDNNEIVQLLRVLPVKYRSVSDSKLGLPPTLSDFVTSVFSSTSSTIASRFPLPERRKAKVTFDIKQINQGGVVDYGGWYQTFSNIDDPMVYVAPLLARAPFYICYNQGVEQFLRSRSVLIGRVSQNRWRNLPNDEIISFAERHVKFNDDFKNCVTTQLAFVFAHEMGHKYMVEAGQQIGSGDVIGERLADCFGLANVKLGGRFEPFVFERLVATDPAANQLSIERLKLRISKIHEMNAYFEATPPPKDGRKLVAACRKLVLNT